MIDASKLDKMEEAACWESSAMAMNVCQLVSEVRRLRHELADPNYQYVGRIHRQAIITRNADIDRLQEEVKRLKSQIAPTCSPEEAPK